MLVPKLRFKHEDGTDFPEWETRQLHNVFVERNETQTIAEDAPLLSFTIEQGVINPEDKKTNKRDFLIKDKYNKKYALTEYNDIIYNPANLKFGAIHRNKLGRGVVSPIYAIFHTGENPIFMEYIVTNPVFIKKSLKYLEGTVIKLMTLKPRDFLLMKCNIPCLEEQQKIADFLSTVDEVIAQSEAEVQNLEQQKKAAMQKIFSQEVRFKREDGTDYPEWEEKILQDVSHYITTTGTSVKSVYVGTENMQKSCAGICFDSENDITVKGIQYVPDDILISNIRPYLKKAWKADRSGICSTDVLCIRGTSEISSDFLYTLLSSDSFFEYVMQGVKGTKMPRGDKKHIMEMPAFIPCLEEQQKIADFLSAYDEAIRYAKQELDKWKELKKGLLQQMFV